MKRIWTLGFALVVGVSMLLAYSAPTWAEEQNMDQSACALDTSWKEPSIASELFGVLALDQNKEELGRVVGVSFSDTEEYVTNFILISSCLPGMNGELVAIPFTGYPYSPSEGILSLGLTKEEFMNAPRYYGAVGVDWAQRALRYWEKTEYFG